MPNDVGKNRVDLGLRVLTAILITFAGGSVLLQLSVRLGILLDSFATIAPVPVVNPIRLTMACESGDSQWDGRSLQIDLVLRHWTVPV
jgi:hypothetical protein